MSEPAPPGPFEIQPPKPRGEVYPMELKPLGYQPDTVKSVTRELAGIEAYAKVLRVRLAKLKEEKS